MKKILKLSLVLVVVMTTMQTYAGEGDFLLYVKKGSEKEIRFSLNGIKKINLAVYDKDNNLIYSENASGKNGILRTYSLDELPSGTYFLEVENNVKKVRYEIIVTDKLASLAKKAITEVYKEELNGKNGTLATL
ncbi:secretion protein [Flavobacterium psychrotolerans]|uniref:Secretion protein n=1 Tax=Flavobacterium psychrotolerans TaxID=2169410 RepID=A0A2U1JQJ2_9FLAO|nr:secretion protein [Flavobacterium psychrotolerans]PWA07447.1 secretion protein [Flavobacterium psychrotolerans]